MTKEQLLDYIPPCGLVCYTCPGFKDGAIKAHSLALLKLNQGFHEFLDGILSDEYRHVLAEHDQFIEKLKKDSRPDCPGCRKMEGRDPGCIKDCFILKCAKEHGVDFCGECNEFPCKRIEDSNIYGKEVKKAFYEGSLLIKKHGAENFFEIKKDVSHYINFAKKIEKTEKESL